VFWYENRNLVKYISAVVICDIQITLDEYVHLLDPFICIDIKKYTKLLSTEALVKYVCDAAICC
jgi:hypothetical protein